jgi:predicted RNA-binding Zn ribbon-like protein
VVTDTHIADLRLDGGHLALDFVNTLGGLRSAEPVAEDEHLRSFADVLAWSCRVGTLSERDAERLTRVARERPDEAEAAFRETRELRTLVDAAMRPLAEEGSPPPDAILIALREADREALAAAVLKPVGGRFRWTWPASDDLRTPLWPLAHAAIDLLTRGPLDRMTVCGNCRWLFLDASRNRSRRWCSMDECGTTVKKRRYVERRRTRRRRASR